MRVADIIANAEVEARPGIDLSHSDGEGGKLLDRYLLGPYPDSPILSEAELQFWNPIMSDRVISKGKTSEEDGQKNHYNIGVHFSAITLKSTQP